MGCYIQHYTPKIFNSDPLTIGFQGQVEVDVGEYLAPIMADIVYVMEGIYNMDKGSGNLISILYCKILIHVYFKSNSSLKYISLFF